jgi:uncharacterized protein YjiS (DUF1127 family)
MKTHPHAYPIPHTALLPGGRQQSIVSLLLEWFRYAAAVLLHYHELQRQLRHLRGLDDRLLLDVGITREEAQLGSLSEKTCDNIEKIRLGVPEYERQGR